MIKQTLQFKDIDGEDTAMTVMFNLTQFEIEGEMELEVIQARFQKFQDEVIGDDPNAPLRPMTGPEKREILGMVKVLIKHSYGKRDGKLFKKSQEIWDEFEQSGAFSAFIYWLFEQPDRANAFMAGIWPQGISRPEDEPRPDLKVVTDDDDGKSGTDVVVDKTPSIEGTVAEQVKDDKWNMLNFSREELLDMSDEDWDEVKKFNTQGRNVPLPLLQIDGMRKARGTTE